MDDFLIYVLFGLLLYIGVQVFDISVKVEKIEFNIESIMQNGK